MGYNGTMSLNPSSGVRGGASEFATTRWSIICAAGRDSSPECREALAALCEQYWYPLYGYARRRVAQVAEAQDLTQAFFAEFLEKNAVAHADPDRGRFRAFLLVSFKHFLSRQWKKARAQKRGGGRVPLSLSFETAEARYHREPSGGLTPEDFYDRQWALTLLETIVERLQSEFHEAGRAALFAQLKQFLIGREATQRYAEVAAELQMSEGAIRMAVTRMRRRYRELLRDEIAQTVDSPEAIEDEIRNLFAALQLRDHPENR